MANDDIDFEELLGSTTFKSDLAFRLDGMSADEYVARVVDEMNQIDLSSIPIDKWDLVVAFMLATLEVAGDFFIGDPIYKNSLANKNGPFCKWLEKFHDKASNTTSWWGHKGSVLDYQDGLTGVRGDHRGKTLSHDLPLARILFGKSVKEEDSSSEKSVKRTWNYALLAHDLVCFSVAIYSLHTGKFVDFGYHRAAESGEKVFGPIVADGYDPQGLFMSVVKYLVHMLADFCSSRSLPIPGFSILTHIPNKEIEAFALKLYRNGMNLRTMALQSIPVGLTELLMSLYVWLREKGAEESYSDEAWQHKKEKLLLMAHGITTAVNVGKVIITKAPWRLNLVVIARTCQLVWRVVDAETKLTNEHIRKLDLMALKARIESSKTLVLLDELLYETDSLNVLTEQLTARVVNSVKSRTEQDANLMTMATKLDAILED